MKTRLWKKRFRLFVWYKFWKHNLKPGLCFLFMHRSGAEKDGSAGAISSIILSAPLTIRLVLPAVAFSLCSDFNTISIFFVTESLHDKICMLQLYCN